MTKTERASIFSDDKALDLSVFSKPATPQQATNEGLEAAAERGFVSREPHAPKSPKKAAAAPAKPTGRPRSPLTEQMTYKARPEVVTRFNQLRTDEGLAESGRVITQGDFLERLLSFYEEHKK